MNAIHLDQLRVDLNTAGAAALSPVVAEVMARWTRVEDQEGPLVVQERLADVLYGDLPRRLGVLLGAPAGDVVVCGGGAQAFRAVMSRLPLNPGERVWVSPHASPAQLSALVALRARTRCRIEVIAQGPEGEVDVAWMARNLDEDVALVCLPYVSAVCGTVQPVHEVGALLGGHRCLYAVDASHAVGQLPVDVRLVGCDLLTGDGWRFLRGPHGAGFAYTAPRLHEVLAPQGGMPPLSAPAPALAALNAALTHHATTGTNPAASPGLSSDSGTGSNPGSGDGVGAGTNPSTDLSTAGIDTGSDAGTGAEIGQLAFLLRAAVCSSPGTELIATGGRPSGIVTFRHARVPAAVLRRLLADRGILVGKIVADESPLYLPRRGITTAVRVSVSHDTTAGDIALFASALHDAIAQGHPQPTPHIPSSVDAPFAASALGTAPAPPSLRTPSARRTVSAPRAPVTLHAVPALPTGAEFESAPLPAPVPAPVGACVPLPDFVPVWKPVVSSAESLRLVSSLPSSSRWPAGAAVGADRRPLHGA
ncbi:aminotransferase class V-fold PLP-dependent enzyme [Streptomyces sp. NPDC086783]|uniref:aminotransferase class V-fold PLP-dependent enzyme n=1 Tax=Streptomyces sp. NPDC086783 TaxID=3365758 RepID=UPI003807E5F7